MPQPKVSYNQILPSTRLGGAAEVAFRVATLSGSLGPSQVWLPGTGKAWEAARELGISARSYDLKSLESRSRLRWALGNHRFFRELRSAGAQVVHFHSPIVYGTASLAVAASRQPAVVHIHLDFSVEMLRWALKRPPRAVVVCAGYLEQLVRASQEEPLRDQLEVVVARNGVDTEVYRPGPRSETRRRIGLPDRGYLLLVVANLAPHKGQLTAIRATHRLVRDGLDVTLLLAGEDRSEGQSFRNQLEQVVTEMGLTANVRFLGFRTDIPALLQAADLLLLPSTSEGLPLSVLQAQATRLPVLAAPTSGIPEVVKHGETGFLVEASDYAGYAAAVASLVDDPKQYRDIAQAAYDSCLREHSWEAFDETIMELYRRIEIS